LTIIFLEVSGTIELADVDKSDPDEDPPLGTETFFGAIGIGAASTLLNAGYPSHRLPDLTHFWHWGRVSSHLTLRNLPVEESTIAL
jgi:hypothetical protein